MTRFLVLAAVCGVLIGIGAQVSRPITVYFGTYTTQQGSRGIYRATLDLRSGTLSEPQLAAESENPSFLAIHSNGRHLYAVNEVGQLRGEKTGGVSAFAIDPASGDLRLVNQVPSRGPAPCYVSIARSGKHVLVANYSGGSVASFRIGEGGRLETQGGFVQHQGSSIDPQRQKGPHAHAIIEDPAGRRVFAADLGIDKLLIYRLDAATGELTPNDPPLAAVAPGGGPRHIAFHPSGRFVYTNNEMARSVTSFSHDAATGTLRELQTISTLPDGAPAEGSTAQILVTSDGRFLYVSNRGHDSIAMFAVDQRNGRLTAIGHVPTQGKTPRNFNLDPSGSYLLAANQDSDTVVVFRVDRTTGRLQPTGSSIRISKPVCVVFAQPRDRLAVSGQKIGFRG
jgi:6-phosphogluconolactonase